jgi:hypothetical protein
LGNDEHHWFVAAIPEKARITTVAEAREALKPSDVHNRQAGLPSKLRSRRRNPAFVRQGEWFFVAMPSSFAPKANLVLCNEPLTRGRGSNTAVFVRGRIRHADHVTVVLDTWHRVFMNTESEANAMRHVAFLD